MPFPVEGSTRSGPGAFCIPVDPAAVEQAASSHEEPTLEAYREPAGFELPVRRNWKLVAGSACTGLLVCSLVAALVANEAAPDSEQAEPSAAAIAAHLPPAVAVPRRAAAAYNTQNVGLECRLSLPGEQCHKQVEWSMSDGIREHPEWYPSWLNSSSTFSDFQLALHDDPIALCPRPCLTDLSWLRDEAFLQPAMGYVSSGRVVSQGLWCSAAEPAFGWGLAECPEHMPLAELATAAKAEAVPGVLLAATTATTAKAGCTDNPGCAHLSGNCCPHDTGAMLACCGSQQVPTVKPDELVAEPPAVEPVDVKILTYNLFWWNLFGMRRGNWGSAGKLIAAANEKVPFDVMGFQECEGIAQVMKDGRMMGGYGALVGPHAMCIAYRKSAWDLLDDGAADVGEDRHDQWYGTRAVMWARLRHREKNHTLLFMNHHGPLPVSTGGRCGGEAVAYNVLKVIASQARSRDSLALVGDFNAGPDSQTLRSFGGRLTRVYTGSSFGGVDNVLTSCGTTLSTANLGSGGSDHDALEVVMRFG